MTASGTRIARWARGAVIDWTLHLVRGAPRRTAEDRFAEIRSDLWEHAADADRRGASGLRLAVELLLRAGAGVPADLAWRKDVLGASPWRREGLMRRKRGTKAWVPLGEPIHGFDNDNGTTPEDERAEVDRHDRDVQDLLAKGFASNAASMGVTGGGF